jgi:hypothetical protein
MFNAESTKSVLIDSPIAQPTMRRLQTSTTIAKKMNPAQVGTYVMSATHSRLASSAAKLRLTRSAAGR